MEVVRLRADSDAVLIAGGLITGKSVKSILFGHISSRFHGSISCHPPPSLLRSRIPSTYYAF